MSQKRLKNFAPKWDIMLDPIKLQFFLKPVDESDHQSSKSIYCIKTITLKQLQKFGREIYNTDYPILPGYILKCFVSYCRHWLNSLCFKHPMIFVQEQQPRTPVYNARDTVPKFMYLAESTIPGAGTGIFTEILLPAGVAFGPYAGVITNGNHNELLTYAWQKLRLDWSEVWIDALNEEMSNWMRFVNSSRWEEEQNLISCFFHGELYYCTYKPVAPHTELLVWYGENYGRGLGISVEYPDNYIDRNTAPPKQTHDDDDKVYCETLINHF